VSGLSDKLTNVEKLKGEKQKLQHALELERTKREALQSELTRLQMWAEKLIGPAYGGLIDTVRDTRNAVERMAKRMSEQLEQLNTSLGEVEGAVATLTQKVTDETQQVLAELERLNNQNPSIDLSPVITRVQGLRTAVDQASTNISNIIADATPPPPEPTSKR